MGRKLHFTWNGDDFRAGNLLWRGTPKDDTFHGKGGDDTISGDKGDDKLYGDKGNDGLYGESGKDKLFGEKGYDYLDGGTGDDQLSGGSQNDTFKFATKYDKDTVTDFQVGPDILTHDTINLSSLKSVKSYEDLLENHMRQAGKNVVIDGGHGDVLVLKNVDLDLLQSYHFTI